MISAQILPLSIRGQLDKRSSINLFRAIKLGGFRSIWYSFDQIPPINQQQLFTSTQSIYYNTDVDATYMVASEIFLEKFENRIQINYFLELSNFVSYIYLLISFIYNDRNDSYGTNFRNVELKRLPRYVTQRIIFLLAYRQKIFVQRIFNRAVNELKNKTARNIWEHR